MIKIGLTGGIGSGKSTVCRLFAERGVAVYDSDGAAKRLMEQDDTLRGQLIERFGKEAYLSSGKLNKNHLAGLVFADKKALADIDALVHPAVMGDFERWTAEQEGDYVIFESAIIFESGLEDNFDKIVAVVAPPQLRVERICNRDKCDVEAAMRRVSAQLDDDEVSNRSDFVIVNIFEDDLEPAVVKLDRIFRSLITYH